MGTLWTKPHSWCGAKVALMACQYFHSPSQQLFMPSDQQTKHSADTASQQSLHSIYLCHLPYLGQICNNMTGHLCQKLKPQHFLSCRVCAVWCRAGESGCWLGPGLSCCHTLATFQRVQVHWLLCLHTSVMLCIIFSHPSLTQTDNVVTKQSWVLQWHHVALQSMY